MHISKNWSKFIEKIPWIRVLSKFFLLSLSTLLALKFKFQIEQVKLRGLMRALNSGILVTVMLLDKNGIVSRSTPYLKENS